MSLLHGFLLLIDWICDPLVLSVHSFSVVLSVAVMAVVVLEVSETLEISDIFRLRFNSESRSPNFPLISASFFLFLAFVGRHNQQLTVKQKMTTIVEPMIDKTAIVVQSVLSLGIGSVGEDSSGN